MILFFENFPNMFQLVEGTQSATRPNLQFFNLLSITFIICWIYTSLFFVLHSVINWLNGDILRDREVSHKRAHKTAYKYWPSQIIRPLSLTLTNFFQHIIQYPTNKCFNVVFQWVIKLQQSPTKSSLKALIGTI